MSIAVACTSLDNVENLFQQDANIVIVPEAGRNRIIFKNDLVERCGGEVVIGGQFRGLRSHFGEHFMVEVSGDLDKIKSDLDEVFGFHQEL